MSWTPEMTQAAKLLGLDPENARHRDLLLKCIHEALWKRGRGRPKGHGSWRRSKLNRLAQLYEKFHEEGIRGDKKIAELIQTNHKKEFGSSAEAIRRWLPYARWVRQDYVAEAWMDIEPPEGWEPPDPDGDD